MKLQTVETWVLWFMIYSIIGWIYETTMRSVKEKRFVNRGFLSGPYCPIYGSGAVIVLIVLGKVQNVFLLFFASVLLTCTLEYFTGWAMESLFHAKWWDYSNRKFNIKGRVCLLGAAAFGTFSVLLIKFLHPFVKSLTDRLSVTALHIVSISLFAIFVADIMLTLFSIMHLNDKLKELSAELEKIKDQVKEYAPIANLSKKFNVQERRIFRAFPKMKSLKYDSALQFLKSKFTKPKSK